MLLSISEMRAKLGEGMGEIAFQPRHLTNCLLIHLSPTSLKNELLAILSSIGLGCKCLAVTNALAYLPGLFHVRDLQKIDRIRNNLDLVSSIVSHTLSCANALAYYGIRTLRSQVQAPGVVYRVTRCFCEKIAQRQQKIAQKVTQPCFCQIYYIKLFYGVFCLILC